MSSGHAGKRAPSSDDDRPSQRPRLDSPALQRIGLHLLSNEFLREYSDLLAQLRALLAFEPVFERPPPKQASTLPKATSRFVRPVGDRLVQVVDNREDHFFAALTVRVPFFSSPYELPQACKEAIRVMLSKQTGLPKWRATQLNKLRSISNKAQSLTKTLKQLPLASESVRKLESVRSVHVAMLCLFCDALKHPDVDLPLNFLRGFNVTGHIPSSGVLRPILPAVTDAQFRDIHSDTMQSNDAWAESVAQSVASQARSASGTQLDLLHSVWKLTKAEQAAGFAGPPLTLKALRQKYGSGASMTCRVIRRHGVVQGEKAVRTQHATTIHTDYGRTLTFKEPLRHSDGSPVLEQKIRLIDDCKRSKHNRCLMQCSETIAPCNFTFLASCCEEIVRQARARNMQRLPSVVFSLDDQKAAYRQVPMSDPQMCIVCMYSFDAHDPGPRFVEMWGHCFGHSSSVTNYYRVPLLSCQIARHFLAVPQEHFFDDFNTPDLRVSLPADSGASAATKGIQDILGFLVEDAKHQPPSVVNVFLGVTTDISNTASEAPYVEFKPSPGRIHRIRSMLTHASVHGLSSHAAQVLLGKLNFLLHAAWGKVGRAALQPLRTRAGQFPFLLKGGLQPPPEGTAWTPALATMASFLDLLFDRLPPFRWYLGPRPRSQLVLYCDAQYSLFGRKGVGFVVGVPDSHNHYMGGDVIPHDLLLWMASFGFDKQTLINQCELLAILVALLSAPDLLRDRDIVIWSDNVGALSACVHGYSRQPEMAALSNAIHLLLADSRSRAYFLHVPGKANCADIPSRVPFLAHGNTMALDPARLSASDARAVAALNASFLPTVFPSASQLADLSTFWSRS